MGADFLANDIAVTKSSVDGETGRDFGAVAKRAAARAAKRLV
jgi:hypothetical protein